MDNYALLGDLAIKLHQDFRGLFYLLLPIFFSLSLIFAWFRNPAGGPDFVDALKRAIIATLLLVGFQEIASAILVIANGLSERISDMSGLDAVMRMAGDKARGYTLSGSSLILGFNDLLVATLSFLSYLILYVARYVMVAIYHFSWVFLSLLAPFLLLFHLFSSKMTLNLFRSLIEIASWQVVWSVLSAILIALPFGNAYMADGNYLTVIVLNFVVAICMLGTPLVVHALVGNGFSAMAGTLGPVVATAMVAAPLKAARAATFGRQVLSNTAGYAKYQGARVGKGLNTARKAVGPRKLQSSSSPQESSSSSSRPTPKKNK